MRNNDWKIEVLIEKLPIYFIIANDGIVENVMKQEIVIRIYVK
jgi:hypothetical protein